MYDVTQTHLALVFRALKELRMAYSKVSGPDLRDCDERKRGLAALLGTKQSSDLLDRLLHTRGNPSVSYMGDRRRVLSQEKMLLDLIGGPRDIGIVRKASKKLAEAGSIDWVNSVADCLAFLEDAHERLRGQLEPASRIQFMRIRRNKRHAERADTAALAVGILLVDLKEVPDLPNSYAIGGHIASLVGI
jgi:hypothetical protein